MILPSAESGSGQSPQLNAVFRIRIRIHLFLGLLDPDPLVRGMDPDPDMDPSSCKNNKKNLDSFFFVLFLTFIL
jgi:hypothetical protein